ncbi:hypothetical protein CAI21_16695 [Alkalilimnicola ehrlichii]|uniref:Diguanylate cyclase with PAS/PAC sensor n=1 Tax=Alkalilimnicola ehrlichii TaxID=351052 RepID=A0A3E0WIC3_9GAMM|nr:GGDEF domain-containing protein [Alkalilimnicola ehrlichii]RFA26599.1 hypothetical protein CAI21_16695 [Alkalilimnicola ehrlichii]RFA31877.1 hypothetical protein CAL65_21125 [Alkalilimnicola ehrlichii]
MLIFQLGMLDKSPGTPAAIESMRVATSADEDNWDDFCFTRRRHCRRVRCYCTAAQRRHQRRRGREHTASALPPATPLRQAAQQMQAARCSSILIMDQGRPVGIWTERDALTVDFTDPQEFERPVEQVMNHPVRTLAEDTPLRSVAALFQRERLRHFLVLDKQGQPIGVLSQTDVVLNQGIEHFLRLRTVASVVRQKTPRLPSDAPLIEAAEQMRSAATDAVLVSYDDGDHGILTERDLVGQIAAGQLNAPLEQLASRPLLTVAHDETLYRVRSLLIERGMRHVGVTADGKLLGLVSFAEILAGIEVTYVRELQSALRERDRALNVSKRSLHLAEKIIESSLEGVMITDPNGIIQSVNPAFTRLTGYTPDEVIGKTPKILSSGRHGPDFYQRMWAELNATGHWQGEIWNRRKNGEIYPELMTVTAIADEGAELTHYAAMFNDISQLKESEERIRSLAYYDPLTGLPNRRLLDDRLQMAIAHAHRHRLQMAVLFVDLDRFKQVNDRLGHRAGDRLLEHIAERLVACVREDDTVARMSGDEFVILLSELETAEEAVQAAERITATLRQPLHIDGEAISPTASVGIALYPEHGNTGDTLIKHADTAMYRAKNGGRDRHSAYSPSANARAPIATA